MEAERREREHRAQEAHGGERERLEPSTGETWRDAYGSALRRSERKSREQFAEFAEDAWERLGEGGRIALERLQQCVVERDIEGLSTAASALAEDDGYAELGELGRRLEGASGGDEREELRTLARMWRNRLRDDPLEVRPETAEALEVLAGAWGGRARFTGADKTRVTANDRGESAAQAWFNREWRGPTGPLARERLDEAATEKLGFAPGELPEDEGGLDGVREALRREDRNARALDRGAPLHVRLRAGEAEAGHGPNAALILEQAAAGACLDAPHRSTLARVRGALAGGIDPRQRAREDCVRAIFSAARDVLDPPWSRRMERRGLHREHLADTVGRQPNIAPEFAQLVRTADEAARTPGVGKVDSAQIRRTLASAPLHTAATLAEAINSAQRGTTRATGRAREAAARTR